MRRLTRSSICGMADIGAKSVLKRGANLPHRGRGECMIGELVACETVAAMVHHLRVRDVPGNLLLCQPKLNSWGWDLRCPVPASPEEAEARNLNLPFGQRWCVDCIAAWREDLVECAAAQVKEEA